MKALYRKYRPQRFDEVIGQDHVIRTLSRALEGDRLGHAYLFCGPRGVGKTTVARLLAKAVNCIGKGDKPCGVCNNCQEIAEGKFIDLIEIDAASNRGIDEMRDLRDKIRFSPSVGKKKVYIIDEVHMLTREAFNALLKTLEEPPAHSLFIFATTEIHKVPQTVISRCQRFDFRLGDLTKVTDVVKTIAKREKLKLSDEVAELISRSSGGSYRDAQSMLDQLSSHITKDEIDFAEAVKLLNLSSRQDASDFIELLKSFKTSEAIDFVSNLDDKGTRLEEFLSNVISALRDEVIETLKNGGDSRWARKASQRFMQATGELKYSPIESLPIELATIELCQTEEIEGVQQEVKTEKKTSIQNSVSPEQAEKKIDGLAQEQEKSVGEAPKREIISLSASKRAAFVSGVSEKNKPLGALLASSQIEYRDGAVKIYVEYPIYVAKIRSKSAVALIEEVLEAIFSQKVRMECEVCKEDDLSEQIGEVFEVD